MNEEIALALSWHHPDEHLRAKKLRAEIQTLSEMQRGVLYALSRLFHRALFQSKMPAKWVCWIQWDLAEAFEVFTEANGRKRGGRVPP